MAKKATDEQMLENYKKLRVLFDNVVTNGSRFSIVYACGVDVGMSDFIVVRRTTYTYSSYIIGYDVNENEIVVLPIDTDINSYGNLISLKKSEITKASRSWLSKEITIYHNSLPKKYIQFTVPEFINQDEDNVTVLVKQDEEAKKFATFFKNQFSK